VNSPYDLCCICTAFADENHHEPERSLVSNEDVDNPKYHRKMCIRHHNERTSIGYKRFKERYPKYDGISIEEYRRHQRQG
jgi:hypothetical protein